MIETSRKCGSKKSKMFFIIGLIFILVGIISNEWILVPFVSPDGMITFPFRLSIWIFDGFMISVGTLIIYYQKILSSIDYKIYLTIFVSVLIGLVLVETGSYFANRYLIRYHNFGNKKSEGSIRIFNGESENLPFGVKNNFEQIFSRKDFSITIKTNNVGLREIKDFNGEKIDIGFVGDSFTFGYGVNHGERYSDLLRSYFPHKNILSLSYPNGFSPPHYYLFLKNNPQYIPTIMIMGMFLGNDISGDIRETDFVFDKDGELLSAKALNREVNDEGIIVRTKSIGSGINRVYDYLEYFYTGKLLIIAHGRLTGIYQKDVKLSIFGDLHKGKLKDINLTGLNYILKLKEFLEERKSILIVFIIPESFAIGDYPERCPYNEELSDELRQGKYLQKSITKWFNDHNIKYIDPSNKFIEYEKKGMKLYYKWDGHWNKDGHKVASELIYRYLVEDKI